MEQRSSKHIKILLAFIAILIIFLAIAAYFIYNMNSQLVESTQQAEISKQQLEDEYQGISTQYEGFKITIKNDSLLDQLSNEQAKVQRLLEELKTVKATDRAEINRLNKELSSLRKILKSYVVQIDSLNRVNERLLLENQEITNKFQETSKTLNIVSQQKESLDQKVSRAAKLDATSINVTATNAKGKVQKKLKNVEQLIISFVITKNITAEPGEKTVYVRIMKPNDEVLIKSPNNLFSYENKEIQYSIQKTIEYGGQEIPITVYWKVDEYLLAGEYRVDIFADGDLIGSKKFVLTQ